MAISVTGSRNPISPVPGHEAHVSFRRARAGDGLIEAWNKSQASDSSWLINTVKISDDRWFIKTRQHTFVKKCFEYMSACQFMRICFYPDLCVRFW